MKNRNMVIFILCMLILFAGYGMVMKRYSTDVPQAPAQVQPPVAEATNAPASATPATALPVVNAQSTVAVDSDALRVIFRTQDGAIQQVIWKADETRFLPSVQPGVDSKNFPGLGGIPTVRFEGNPEIQATAQGKTVTFHNAAGDRLEYQIPAKGYQLAVNWSSTEGAPLNLIAKPQDEGEAFGLGRVFTLEGSSLHSETWGSMLKDPFILFKMFGSKRKVLPESQRIVGMDAGIEKVKSQSNHYFAAIWELNQAADRDLQTGYSVRPDAKGGLRAKLFLGPQQADTLAAAGEHYGKVLDFGFFGLISQFLFWILRLIQKVIPNWGWAIVIFTLILRGALWPLNTKTTVSMLRMKELEPHQKEIQAKYAKFGNDMAKKGEQQKELMAFYKKNGHNPMGGCLPMILQMPVFLALWSMLNAVYELRHAHFAFWLTDLSAKDPYFVLPVLLGATMLIQQILTPMTMGDPTQRRMMTIVMPVMMVFFFGSTPAGLCLYYFIFNLVGMSQTWYLKKTYKPKPVVL